MTIRTRLRGAFEKVDFSMLKSHVEELLAVYECIFQDISNTYPALRDEFKLDLEHLVKLVASRGPGVLYTDLPAAGKHFDRCLSEGRFCVSSLPLTKRCPRHVMYPQFLRGLFELVFDKSGILKEDCDVEAIIFLRQLYNCGKKASVNCADSYVRDAVTSFVSTDDQLPEPEGFWEADQPTREEIESYTGFSRSPIYLTRVGADECQLSVLLKNLDLVSGILSSTLGSYDPSEWRFRHGPGVVSERKGLVNKYQFVNWSDRLEASFAFADYGFYNHSAWARHVLGSFEVGSSDPASRLISVPKTFTKPRLIAAEPSEHQWCQQNIWDYFGARCTNSWIGKFVRFRDQTYNQDLCRLASVDGSLATLDLSEASDRVTCHFVANLFRTNLGLLRALQSSRTRWIKQDITADVPELIKLKKFSTMGSACTFPVESLGFLCVALAATLTCRGSVPTRKTILELVGQVAVFGDDIIIPTDCRELMVRALEVFHFKVNTAKSFWNGNFRESCGVDAFRGVDISPVYWRSPAKSDPESIASVLTVRNNFYKRGYWITAAYLASTIPRGLIPTVSIDSGAFGVESFLGPCIRGFSRRVCRDLQKDQVLALRLTSQCKREHSGCDSVLLQFFTEDPEPHSEWRGGVASRPKLRLRLGWVDVESLGS